jgi:hypothetical protein
VFEFRPVNRCENEEKVRHLKGPVQFIVYGVLEGYDFDFESSSILEEHVGSCLLDRFPGFIKIIPTKTALDVCSDSSLEDFKEAYGYADRFSFNLWSLRDPAGMIASYMTFSIGSFTNFFENISYWHGEGLLSICNENKSREVVLRSLSMVVDEFIEFCQKIIQTRNKHEYFH